MMRNFNARDRFPYSAVLFILAGVYLWTRDSPAKTRKRVAIALFVLALLILIFRG